MHETGVNLSIEECKFVIQSVAEPSREHVLRFLRYMPTTGRQLPSFRGVDADPEAPRSSARLPDLL